MEIKSPKTMVQEVVDSTKESTKTAFGLKNRSTLNGAIFGAFGGFAIAYYTEKPIYMGALLGALAGGFISNILTVKK